MYPELQEIIATIEDILPPKYISATIGCFWDGEKIVFSATTTTPTDSSPLLLTKNLETLIEAYREDCGDEWKTAVFGIFADGHINIYFGDEVPHDHLDTFLSENFSENFSENCSENCSEVVESSPEMVESSPEAVETETLGEAMT